MLSDYWPKPDQIERCIRTEAEELAEHVLLAVHEPMVLIRRRPGEVREEFMTESDLLEQLLRVDRPIPIIGESGIGKSHLIRWLDAKLKVHPDATNWHIRRIPKNAGLRGVLELLLDGLEGKEFEDLRSKITSVGDRLSDKEVADYLVVGMGHRLERLAGEAERQIQAIRHSGQKVDLETQSRLKLLQKHAVTDKLPTLLNDPFFNSFLKNPDTGCIFQIAKRLTGQCTNSELARNDYKLTPNDLHFDIHIGDLSGLAKAYVTQATLNTNPASRAEATNLLNEIINDACRETFYHFFQFNSGSFQELFASIRRHLREQGKTLVLLVEDMAAISAIEDVLIDSLITEGVRDGEQLLCPLRSAIAVTEGYVGYQRRRNTLATRAQYEWYLPNRIRDDAQTLTRIERFCGRYLNAARIGEEELRATYDPNNKESTWPWVWCSKEPDDEEVLKCFERTDEGISLFPFNRNALAALANEYCLVHDELVFNPRTVLHHILRNILIHYRSAFEAGAFPPKSLNKTECPGALASELAAEHLDDSGHAEKFAAIWGWRSGTLRDLAQAVPSGVARAFGLTALAGLLERMQLQSDPGPKPRQPTPWPSDPPGQPAPRTPGKPEAPLKPIPEMVDEWFKREDIPQTAAVKLRSALVRDLKSYGDAACRWWGITTLPQLIRGRDKPLIHIPFNANNPTGNLMAAFGSEKEFKQHPVRYKGVITAILRRDHFGGWENYPEGYDDFCRYRAFMSSWMPKQLNEIVDTERSAALDAYCQQGSIAALIEPRIAQLNKTRRLSVLSKPMAKVVEEYQLTGITEWDELVKTEIGRWESVQQNWLSWYSTRRGRGVEGDLLRPRVGAFTAQLPDRIRVAVSRISRDLKDRYRGVCTLLTGCSTKEEFNETLNALKEVVELMRDEDQYKSMDDQLSSRKFLNRVTKTIDLDCWSTVKSLLMLDQSGENWSSIRDIRTADLDVLNEILVTWRVLYQRNFSRITDENVAAGAVPRARKREQVTRLLEDITEALDGIGNST